MPPPLPAVAVLPVMVPPSMVKLHFSPTYTPPPPPSGAAAVLPEIVPPCMVNLGGSVSFVVPTRNTPPVSVLPEIVPPYMVKAEPVAGLLCRPTSTPPIIVPPYSSNVPPLTVTPPWILPELSLLQSVSVSFAPLPTVILPLIVCLFRQRLTLPVGTVQSPDTDCVR